MQETQDNDGQPRVRAVLFDYGLVLTGPPEPTAWQRMKTLLEAEEEPFHAAYWQFRHRYDLGELSGEAYWRAVAAALGCVPNQATLAGLAEADTQLWTQPNVPMIAWARTLQLCGVKTGILSNLGDAMETGVRACCPWLEDFTHHTFSHRLLIAKPDAAIYRHAAEGLGAAADEILFVDDREDNIAGALAAGMQAVRYLEHAEFVRELQARGYGAVLPLPAMA